MQRVINRSFLVIFEMKCLSIIRLRAINECTEYKICQICFMRKSMSKMIVISTEQTALCTEWSAPMDWHTRCTLLHWTLTAINSLPFEMHLKHVLWHRNYGILDICGYTKHSERIFHLESEHIHFIFDLFHSFQLKKKIVSVLKYLPSDAQWYLDIIQEK